MAQHLSDPAAKNERANDGPHSEQSAPTSLIISQRVTLSLGDRDLLVFDKSAAAKRNRTCCIPSPASSSSAATRSIPFYNVLWAALSDDAKALTIDFAEEVSRTRVRAASLSFAVSEPALARTIIDSWIESLLGRAYGEAARSKRAYVLVNPHAGRGAAEAIWDKQVRPLFAAARMSLSVVRTTHAGQAVDLAEGLDIDAFDIAIACSGDGLAHELFNGLGRRPDARRALSKIAVCHIPCGSGNAMSCNVYGTHKPSLAALAIIKGVPTPLDLVSITQGDRRILSFLSQALGIVAEVDLATENLRWMGGHRFTYGFLVRVLKRMVYPCDIAMKVEIGHKDLIKNHYRSKLLGGSSREAVGTAPAEESGETGGQSSVSEQGEPATDNGQGLPPLRYGTVTDGLPDGWELVPHEKLGNFYCGNMAYMAPDANFFSAALANDGLMDVIMIDGDISPLKAIEMQLSLESGHFFDNPLVTYRKVSAYRIIPRNVEKGGYISIDGERIPFEPFQAEVHQSLGLTISKKGGFEAPGPLHWDKVTASERLMA
ncbi:hypothetical protein VTK73DRAFT_6679 [Phialemonium thermophilum]|uniref:DAGKc domain-containing protein n=1 Tax=Phialemonium thermophilum TaxID=223376 RepID=A0ABR3WIA6_9PEZI